MTARKPAIPARVQELAETLNANLPLGRGDELLRGPDWIVWLGRDARHPAFTVVQGLRFTDDRVELAVDEIRALLRQRGRARATWEIGPSATPRDLVARLERLGMRPDAEPIAAGMVLSHPPTLHAIPPSQAGITVRKADTVGDLLAAYELLHTVFGERTETSAQRQARAEREMEAAARGKHAVFIAWRAGLPIAAANAIYVDDATVLAGGATLPDERRHGAYAALVAARWQDAVARKKPLLVVQAGKMSRPILERLGFVTVAEIRVLLDELK